MTALPYGVNAPAGFLKWSTWCETPLLSPYTHPLAVGARRRSTAHQPRRPTPLALSKGDAT